MHNIAVAFVRTHGYPTLQTINGNLSFDTIPIKQILHEKIPILDRVSCITLDTVGVSDQHFFRISRRVTIPDFCFSMAIFVLESDKAYIKQHKNEKKIELYIGFPNIMKNNIKTYTYVNTSNSQFKTNFTDNEFKIWTQKCMSRMIDIFPGNNELHQKFISYYCVDSGCDGYNGAICYIDGSQNKYISCVYCKKDICIKCFKLDHGLSDCNITHDEMTAQTIANSTKKCPNCFLSTEKSTGCNHIQCRCNTHWCWGCVVKLDSNDPYHHNGTICPNHLATDMNVWRPDIPLPN
jgi:hypothetical protein